MLLYIIHLQENLVKILTLDSFTGIKSYHSGVAPGLARVISVKDLALATDTAIQMVATSLRSIEHSLRRRSTRSLQALQFVQLNLRQSLQTCRLLLD